MSERHSQSSMALDCEQLTCQVTAVLFIKATSGPCCRRESACCAAVRCGGDAPRTLERGLRCCTETSGVYPAETRMCCLEFSSPAVKGHNTWLLTYIPCVCVRAHVCGNGTVGSGGVTGTGEERHAACFTAVSSGRLRNHSDGTSSRAFCF